MKPSTSRGTATTGSESKPGQYQKEGIELAIKQINDAGASW